MNIRGLFFQTYTVFISIFLFTFFNSISKTNGAHNITDSQKSKDIYFSNYTTQQGYNLAGNNILDAKYTSQNILIIGTDNGISIKFDQAKDVFNSYNLSSFRDLTSKNNRNIAVSTIGNVAIATDNGVNFGVLNSNKNDYDFYSFSPDFSYQWGLSDIDDYAVSFDGDEYLAVGTHNGLYVGYKGIDKDRNRIIYNFKKFTTLNGLASNFINSLAFSSDNLLIATNNGLQSAQINPPSNPKDINNVQLSFGNTYIKDQNVSEVSSNSNNIISVIANDTPMIAKYSETSLDFSSPIINNNNYFADCKYTKFIANKENDYCLSTINEGIYYINNADFNNPHNYRSKNNIGLLSNQVNSVAFSDTGSLVVSTNKGLNISNVPNININSSDIVFEPNLSNKNVFIGSLIMNLNMPTNQLINFNYANYMKIDLTDENNKDIFVEYITPDGKIPANIEQLPDCQNEVISSNINRLINIPKIKGLNDVGLKTNSKYSLNVTYGASEQSQNNILKNYQIETPSSSNNNIHFKSISNIDMVKSKDNSSYYTNNYVNMTFDSSIKNAVADGSCISIKVFDPNRFSRSYLDIIYITKNANAPIDYKNGNVNYKYCNIVNGSILDNSINFKLYDLTPSSKLSMFITISRPDSNANETLIVNSTDSIIFYTPGKNNYLGFIAIYIYSIIFSIITLIALIIFIVYFYKKRMWHKHIESESIL